MNATARGGRATSLRAWRRVRWHGLTADAYLFYTATLAPVAIAVALLARRPGEVVIAVLLSATAVAAQLALGLIGRRRRLDGVTGWHIVRLVPPLAFVGLANQLIGGDALPLIALYIPVVAGAAAAGAVEGVFAAAIAAFAILVPELGELGSSSALALRAVTLAGVSFVLAFGTRRIVAALEEAVVVARRSTVAERRRGRQIEALDAVGHVLAGRGPTPEVLQEVVEVVRSRFGYPRVSVYLGDADAVALAAQVGFSEQIERFTREVGIAGRVLREGSIAFVPDIASEPAYVNPSASVTSLICAPLLIDGTLVGILNVETSGGRRLDETDRAVVGIVATRIAAAIELGRDRQALADRAELFHAIELFGRAVSASLAMEPLAQTIVDAAARVVPADTLALTLLDRAEGRYVVRAVVGAPEDVVGREIRPGEGLAGRAIRDRTMVVDDAFSDDKLPAAVQGLELRPLTRGVAVPLVRDAVVVGALTVARGNGRSFSELELEGLGLIASSAALAIANAYLHAEVGELAIRDALTGLYNRRHFDEALERMLAGRRRERLSGWRPLSAVTFDLDKFGAFNKEHGHLVGDAVLRSFADVLRARFRSTDLVARLGGEEFVVVLDGASLEAAVSAADEVRAAVAAKRIRSPDGRELQVTVSAGCAELDPAEPTRESLLRTADVALFMAKRAGRDRVVAA